MIFLNLILCLFLPLTVAAEIEDTIQLGPAVEVKSNHRLNNSSDGYIGDAIIHAVPIGFVKLGPLMVNDKGVQLSFLNDQPFALYLNANSHGEYYKSTGMAESETSFFIGGGVRIYPLSIFILKDLEQKSRGQLTRFQLQAPLHLGEDWLFFPTVGYTYFDSAYSDYYYGVSASQATTTRLEHHPENAHEIFYNLKVFYKAFEAWEFYLMLEHKEFSSDITDSPTVNDKTLFTGTTGFMYKFL